MGADVEDPEANGPHELPSMLLERLERLGSALSTDLVGTLGRRPRPVARLAGDASERSARIEELRARGLMVQSVPGVPAAISVSSEQRDQLLSDPLIESGVLYLQGASSQRAAELVGARPGEHVLDLAAAPGGKTMILAAAMQGEGRLVAVEPVRDRFYRLKANLERAGHDWVETLRTDGRKLPVSFRSAFDRVLLDAPCSADVRIVPEDPETWSRWSVAKIRDLARKQWGLLGAALWAVKPGGTVVYSTCTFAPEEDEAVVAAHLAASVGGKNGRAEVEAVDLGDGVSVAPGLTGFGKKAWPDAVAATRRILPDELHEGFFVARLRRTDEPDEVSVASRGSHRRGRAKHRRGGSR